MMRTRHAARFTAGFRSSGKPSPMQWPARFDQPRPDIVASWRDVLQAFACFTLATAFAVGLMALGA
jgi:hypothetical protein